MLSYFSFAFSTMRLPVLAMNGSYLRKANQFQFDTIKEAEKIRPNLSAQGITHSLN